HRVGAAQRGRARYRPRSVRSRAAFTRTRKRFARCARGVPTGRRQFCGVARAASRRSLSRRTRRRISPLLRRVPGAPARRRGGHRPEPGQALALRGHAHRARERPRPARRQRSRADVAMHTHEAGALHADVRELGAQPLQPPADLNQLASNVWPSNVRRADDGGLAVAGVAAVHIAREFGTPAYVVDEDDFRARCRAWLDAFPGADVYYAGKAFLTTAVARWVAEEGLNLDVCTGGELAVALHAGFEPSRIALHGNNKSMAELTAALDAGVGHIVVDSFDEIDRLAKLAAGRETKPWVLVRTTVGVEAHTHEFIATAHEDQKFGFSLAGGD